MKSSHTALKQAIERAGGQSAFARLLDVGQSTVHFWLTESKKGLPAHLCDKIEKATGISKADLRPDVF
jgi:DNA-binding transcriptional regulator YdaS (Cro superfamily)